MASDEKDDHKPSNGEVAVVNSRGKALLLTAFSPRDSDSYVLLDKLQQRHIDFLKPGRRYPAAFPMSLVGQPVVLWDTASPSQRRGRFLPICLQRSEGSALAT